MRQPIPSILNELDAGEALLFDYVRGALDEAMAVLAASYAAMNARAAESLRELECLAGALFEELEAAPVSEACKQSVFDKLDGAERLCQTMVPHSILPAPLRAYTKCDCCDIAWKPYKSGVEHVEVVKPKTAPNRAELMRMHPGIQAPQQRSAVYEYTLVIDGYLLEGGRALQRGDLVIHPRGERAQPSACDQHGCIALIVTEGQSLNGLLHRLLKAW